MSALRLVIFDCDGVLVDSERITNRVFCAMLNDLGLNLTLEDMFEHFVGLSMPQCIERVTRMLGSAPPADFLQTLTQRSEAALQAEVITVPDVTKALDEIRIPSCVASSGDHKKIRLTLAATGLLERFGERIFSVTDVKRAKPAPDIFLFAAHRMGVDPSECVVVEDTPIGVRAGVAAGMRVLGFSANTPEHRLVKAGAHVIFAEMRVLPELLQTLSAEYSLQHHRGAGS
jgi:HAD superfamily hydrolase (TIGR01509 family)